MRDSGSSRARAYSPPSARSDRQPQGEHRGSQPSQTQRAPAEPRGRGMQQGQALRSSSAPSAFQWGQQHGGFGNPGKGQQRDPYSGQGQGQWSAWNQAPSAPPPTHGAGSPRGCGKGDSWLALGKVLNSSVAPPGHHMPGALSPSRLCASPARHERRGMARAPRAAADVRRQRPVASGAW